MNDGVLPGEDRVPRYLAGIAALLTVAMVAETIARVVGPSDWPNGDPLVVTEVFLVGVVTSVPFVAALGYAGYRLPRSRLEPARYPRILRWVLGTAVASLLFNLVLIAVIGVASAGMFVAWVRWSVAVGAGLGLAVGASEARAVQQSVETARTAARARHAAEQRDLLDYLNGLLRHEILNASQVIAGHAELLMADHDRESETHAHGRTIYAKSEDVTDVIQNVRDLLDATGGKSTLEPVDAAVVLREEVTAVERATDADVEASIPERATVRANPLLGRVFGNLLANAVEHNDADEPSIRVTMRCTDETVVVAVADDGPGIPDDVAARLFERPDSFTVDHGLGLYIASELVRQFGGDVELVETNDDGSAFEVELPRASAEPDDAPTESPARSPATDGLLDRARSP